MRKKVLSITKDDLRVESFRPGGAGGQHRDKTSNGVRIVHKDSGAIGMSTESRSWHENRKIAFQRLTKSPRFRAWIGETFPPEEFEPQPKRRYTYKAPNISLEGRSLQERER